MKRQLQQSTAEQSACLICHEPATAGSVMMKNQIAGNAVWFRPVHRSCLFASTSQRAAVERQGWIIAEDIILKSVITEDVIMQKRAGQ